MSSDTADDGMSAAALSVCCTLVSPLPLVLGSLVRDAARRRINDIPSVTSRRVSAICIKGSTRS